MNSAFAQAYQRQSERLVMTIHEYETPEAIDGDDEFELTRIARNGKEGD